MDSPESNKRRNFTLSLIHRHVYDRVVDVGRRFIEKMTVVCRIQLFHLFIARGNCRHETRALAYKREEEIHTEHCCVRNSGTSFQGVSRWIIEGCNCLSLIFSCWLSTISPFYVSYFHEKIENKPVYFYHFSISKSLKTANIFNISVQSMVRRCDSVKLLISPENVLE
jgi:hypothetical protein